MPVLHCSVLECNMQWFILKSEIRFYRSAIQGDTAGFLYIFLLISFYVIVYYSKGGSKCTLLTRPKKRDAYGTVL